MSVSGVALLVPKFPIVTCLGMCDTHEAMILRPWWTPLASCRSELCDFGTARIGGLVRMYLKGARRCGR